MYFLPTKRPVFKHELASTLPYRQPRTERHALKHEYERKGALAYLAALDVHNGRIFGLCESSSGIEPFNRLLSLIMSRKPYCSAKKVYLIVDNGSSHRGQVGWNLFRVVASTVAFGCLAWALVLHGRS